MALTTGVVGLGNIGGGVAKNLAAAGNRVIGYDIDAGRISTAGVETGADAADLAARCDLVILAVPTLTAWRAPLAAISASGRRGLVVADLCTFPIDEKQGAHDELGRAGIEIGLEPDNVDGDRARLRGPRGSGLPASRMIRCTAFPSRAPSTYSRAMNGMAPAGSSATPVIST